MRLRASWRKMFWIQTHWVGGFKIVCSFKGGPLLGVILILSGWLLPVFSVQAETFEKPAAEPAAMQRLFMTPAQRVSIERARQKQINPVASPNALKAASKTKLAKNTRPGKVTAVIRLPDGRQQVRLNGRYQIVNQDAPEWQLGGKVRESND